MTLSKIAAAFAATALVAAQPAVAAPRASSDTVEAEGLAGTNGAWPAVIAILIIAAVSLLSASNDDDPSSP